MPLDPISLLGVLLSKTKLSLFLSEKLPNLNDKFTCKF